MALPNYRVLIADAQTLDRLATVNAAANIAYAYELNAPADAGFSVPIGDELFTEIPDLLVNPSKYALVIERDGARVWAGMLFDWDVSGQEKNSRITFSAKDWTQMLGFRVTTEDLRYGVPAGTSPVDAGAIALDVIDRQQRGQSMRIKSASAQFLVAPANNANMIPNNTGADVTKGFTVGCWIKPETVNTFARIARKAINDTISWELKHGSDGSLIWDIGSGGGTTYSTITTAAGVLAAGTVYSIIGVWKPGYMALYLNGKLVASKTTGVATSVYAGTEDLHIGSRNGNPFTQHFNGWIDDLFILAEPLAEPVTVAGSKFAIKNQGYVAASGYEMGRTLNAETEWALGEQWSIDFWVKENQTDFSGFFSTRRVMSIGPEVSGPSYESSSVGIYSYRDAGNDKMLLEVFGGEFAHVVSNIEVTWASTWNHIVVSRESATVLKVYVNGSLVSTTNPTALDYALGGSNKVLRLGDDDSGWAGQYDELRIFNRGLSAAEVTASYNTGSGIYGETTDAGLVAGYHFDEGSKKAEGSYRHKVTDYGPNGLHLDWGWYNVGGSSDNPTANSDPVYIDGKVLTLGTLDIHTGAKTPLDYDLRGYWRFDSGTAVKTFDYSGNGNHLNLGNAPTYEVGILGYLDGLDMGIRAGTIETTQARDREYDLKSVLELIQQLSAVRNGFDFQITPDRTLNIYAMRGNDRPDVVFEWGKSFRSFKVAATTTNLVNQAIAIGQGSSSAGDTGSPATHAVSNESIRGSAGLRQRVLSNPDVSEGATLDQLTQEAIRQGAVLQKVYSFTLLKNATPEYGTYSIGDRVRLVIKHGAIDEDVTQRIYGQKIQVTSLGSEQVDLKVAGV